MEENLKFWLCCPYTCEIDAFQKEEIHRIFYCIILWFSIISPCIEMKLELIFRKTLENIQAENKICFKFLFSC